MAWQMRSRTLGLPQQMRSQAQGLSQHTRATLVSHGRTNAEIGEQMGLCERIVKLEITHACTVLHAHNRAHLAANAIRRGLIQ